MTQSAPWPIDRIAQAIGDPGSIVGRCFGPSWKPGNVGYMAEQETFPRWATRAVIAVLDEFDRDLQRKVDRAVQLQTEMAAKYFPVGPLLDLSNPGEPAIYAAIADRLPPGVDPLTPPKPLANEFPAELGDRPPAGAVYGIDGQGDRWIHIVGATVQHTKSMMTAPVSEIVRDYDGIRWFDAADNEITSDEVSQPFPIVTVDPAEIAEELGEIDRANARAREDEEASEFCRVCGVTGNHALTCVYRVFSGGAR